MFPVLPSTCNKKELRGEFIWEKGERAAPQKKIKKKKNQCQVAL